MLELVPVSVTFESLIKIILIIGTNMLLGYIWYSPSCFQKQWKQAKGIKDDIPCTNNAILMSNIGTLANAFLLHILLIAFDIRRQQWIGAILTSAILSGFYAFNGWNYVFFSTKAEYRAHRLLYLIDIGFTFTLYALVSLVLIFF